MHARPRADDDAVALGDDVEWLDRQAARLRVVDEVGVDEPRDRSRTTVRFMVFNPRERTIILCFTGQQMGLPISLIC